MMRIDCGKFDRICTLVSTSSGENEIGEVVYNEVDVFKFYAEVKGVRGREIFSNEATVNENKRYLKVVTRYHPRFNSFCKIRYNGELWDISSVTELGRREYLEIMCNIEVMI